MITPAIATTGVSKVTLNNGERGPAVIDSLALQPPSLHRFA
jgi:hypothetical protein